MILWGLLIMVIGIALGVTGFAVAYVSSLSGGINTTASLVFQLYWGSSLASLVLGGIGLFLVFWGVALLRPSSRPWTLIAAVGALVTGVTSAVLRALLLFLVMSTRPSISDLQVISAALFLVGAAGGFWLIAGLFGMTRSLNLT